MKEEKLKVLLEEKLKQDHEKLLVESGQQEHEFSERFENNMCELMKHATSMHGMFIYKCKQKLKKRSKRLSVKIYQVKYRYAYNFMKNNSMSEQELEEVQSMVNQKKGKK